MQKYTKTLGEKNTLVKHAKKRYHEVGGQGSPLKMARQVFPWPKFNPIKFNVIQTPSWHASMTSDALGNLVSCYTCTFTLALKPATASEIQCWVEEDRIMRCHLGWPIRFQGWPDPHQDPALDTHLCIQDSIALHFTVRHYRPKHFIFIFSCSGQFKIFWPILLQYFLRLFYYTLSVASFAYLDIQFQKIS